MSDTDRSCKRRRAFSCSRSFLAALALPLGCFFVLGLPIHLAQSAPPANDQCFSGEVIPASGPFPYTSFISDIADATTSGDPPLPPALQGQTPSRSVWYAFTPAATAFY